MALVITAGAAIATSFQTVAQATTVLTAAPFTTTAWGSLSTALKENLLVMAAASMDFIPWRGWKVYDQQALCFPRTYQTDQTVILQEIMDAQAYIAWLVCYKGINSLPAYNATIGNPSIKNVSLGGLLDVGFASEPLQVDSARGGSLLTAMMMGSEFPIWLKIRDHVASFRVLGIEDRPDLLEAVTS